MARAFLREFIQEVTPVLLSPVCKSWGYSQVTTLPCSCQNGSLRSTETNFLFPAAVPIWPHLIKIRKQHILPSLEKIAYSKLGMLLSGRLGKWKMLSGLKKIKQEINEWEYNQDRLQMLFLLSEAKAQSSGHHTRRHLLRNIWLNSSRNERFSQNDSNVLKDK